MLPLDWLAKVQKISRESGVKVHMDGARVMNAAVYQKIPVSEIAKYVDSICFCLSKGLGAPVGSILSGSKSFVAKYVFLCFFSLFLVLIFVLNTATLLSDRYRLLLNYFLFLSYVTICFLVYIYILCNTFDSRLLGIFQRISDAK